MMMKPASTAIFSTLLTLASVSVAQATVSLSSHQAIYELDLKSANAASEVQSVDGKTHYILQKTCDGWETSENYAISFGFNEGNNANFISRYKTWESEDGASFTFDIVENSNALGEKAFEGFANQNGDSTEAFHSDGDGAMRYLPDDTVFPVQHLLTLLNAAQEGTPVIRQSHMFFGGEIDDSLYFVSAILGPQKEDAPKRTLKKAMGTLSEDSYWPLSISYYKPEEQAAEPEYAIAFQLQNNGIIRGYTVDYGTFKMRAKLKTLTPLDPADCS